MLSSLIVIGLFGDHIWLGIVLFLKCKGVFGLLGVSLRMLGVTGFLYVFKGNYWQFLSLPQSLGFRSIAEMTE
jgi:hypothetical protein